MAGIPKNAKVIDGVAYIPLTDDIHQDEPLAYVVLMHDKRAMDYRVFWLKGHAQRSALDQADAYKEETGESIDWPIYPLYATHALNLFGTAER